VERTTLICSSLKPGGGRRPLPGNWAIRACAPGTAVAALADSRDEWIEIGEAVPVAAALRARGDWTLDGAARDFDASDWWYRLHFDSPARDADERVMLGFDGLATLATVWLNGRQLLQSDNMFVAHECDVTDALRPGANELLIRIAALRRRRTLARCVAGAARWTARFRRPLRRFREWKRWHR
jgi:beta-mannosidase